MFYPGSNEPACRRYFKTDIPNFSVDSMLASWQLAVDGTLDRFSVKHKQLSRAGGVTEIPRPSQSDGRVWRVPAVLV